MKLIELRLVSISLIPRLSCVGGEKKSLVRIVCAYSVPPGFLGILDISVRYTSLREASQFERCLLTRIIHVSVHCS